ncbi:unnamed protein product [Macrosiphum euphorbiae]|uniref:Transposable element P transposase-like RNase H C-terminal domain-containing protein n=1 Tax=Macrosiphum euphorbiae TaxID=13131 RepID=A0AAV0XTU1_9HEMI|nr:unnamed protein product [Macrosiphum euphorbiae]
MNQDALELFFGTVRQSTGPNDHPATPTFLQNYKLLSIYSVIKPPKTGNCQVLNSEVPKISIDDIKNIYDTDDVSERVKNIEALKLKLSNCMDNEDWEADSIFEDHNYFKSPTVDCVVFNKATF